MPWMERRQVGLYLLALVLGAATGLSCPGSGRALEHVVEPALFLLLVATFMAVPLARIRDAAGDLRFLGTLLVLNFLAVPVVAFGLTPFLAHDPDLLVGALLVLLAPCIDYVVVFARLAGGSAEKLTAATPVLMLVQILLVPAYLRWFGGEDAAQAVAHTAPFLRALVVFVLIPLGLAAVFQGLDAARAARSESGTPVRAASGTSARTVRTATDAAMVPLMMLVLFAIAASQTPRVAQDGGRLLILVPVYAAFLAIMAALGVVAGRATSAAPAETRALALSAATRNSLVVLPLALALPPSLALAPAAVVTQTMVELLGLLVLVRVLPRLAPARRNP